MEIVLAIIGIVLAALALLCCIRPYVPAAILAYAAMWMMQWSGVLEFPTVMLSYWGAMVVVVVLLASMQSQALSKATQGMTHITIGAAAGMLAGMTAGYAPMIIGAFLGAFAGTVLFARSPKGHGLGMLTSRFLQYFGAKGLPVVIAMCLIGIIIEVAVVQHAGNV